MSLEGKYYCADLEATLIITEATNGIHLAGGLSVGEQMSSFAGVFKKA